MSEPRAMKPHLPLTPPPPNPDYVWIRWWAWRPVITLEGHWAWGRAVERCHWHSRPADAHRRTLDPTTTFDQWREQRRFPELSQWAYREPPTP